MLMSSLLCCFLNNFFKQYFFVFVETLAAYAVWKTGKWG